MRTLVQWERSSRRPANSMVNRSRQSAQPVACSSRRARVAKPLWRTVKLVVSPRGSICKLTSVVLGSPSQVHAKTRDRGASILEYRPLTPIPATLLLSKYSPPSRRSTLAVVSKRGGQNHDRSSSGSVKAANTASGGAANSRVSMRSSEITHHPAVDPNKAWFEKYLRSAAHGLPNLGAGRGDHDHDAVPGG